MHVQLAGVFFIKDDGTKGAGIHNLLHGGLVWTKFFEPVLIVMAGIVHGATGGPDHTAQSDVLDAGAEATGRVAFYVSEVDHKGGVFNVSSHLPIFDVLVRPLVAVEVLLFRSARRKYRAAQHLMGITTRLASIHVPTDIGNKGLATAVFNSLHHFAYKNRVNHRIANIVAHMQFNAHLLVFDTVANMQTVNNKVQFGRQSFASIQVRLARRAKIHSRCHFFT
ncbi:hypothetical protein SDC9_91078 [bioreactor metagenome]|uniref:Uncharacterized protein n=1 Tax=bioreactor metagenome TaxID=1076179 RepID=A0A644ZTU9_9ZZZZ